MPVMKNVIPGSFEKFSNTADLRASGFTLSLKQIRFFERDRNNKHRILAHPYYGAEVYLIGV